MSQFTRLQRGDSIAPLEPTPGKDGLIYAFIDAASCDACFLTFISQINALSRDFNIKTVVFISGKTQEYADMEQKKSQWPFEVVGDPKYLYSKYYGIRATPFFFVANSAGKVLAMDKCGGVHLDMADIHAALLHERQTATDDNSRKPFQTIKKFIVHQPDGRLVDVSDVYHVLSDPTSSTYALMDVKNKIAYRLDSTGRVVNSIDISRIVALGRVGPSWIVPGRSILDCYQMLTGDLAFNAIDLTNGSITLIPFSDDRITLPKSPYTMIGAWYDPGANHIVAAVQNIKRDTLLRSDEPTFAIVVNGHSALFSGRPNEVLTRYRMNGVFNSQIGFDGAGNIYEVQCPGRVMRRYSSGGTFLDSIEIPFGRQWRTMTRDITNPDMKEWIAINTNLSYLNALFPGKDGNRIGIIYQTVDYPDGVLDPHSRASITHRYLMIFSRDGSVLVPEVEIPFQNIFAVAGKTVGATQYSENHVSIIWADISR